jgi:hypothetical protein
VASTAKPVPASAAHTPVDLQSYASWKQETNERSAAVSGIRRSFARRALIDLPAAAAGGGGSVSEGPPAPGAEFEPVSPLDVPAFLRRQSEG